MKKLVIFLMCISSVANSAETYLANPNIPWLIIFLDIDGVLYREPGRPDFYDEREAKMVEIFGKLDYYLSFHYDVATAYYFDKTAVAFLEDFIDQANLDYNVGIVLSSAWREERTLEEIREVFSPWRFSEFIIDKTVSSGYTGYTLEELKGFSYGVASRADQINHWMIHHSNIGIAHFIIFDDQDSDLSKHFLDRFVHVRTPHLSSADIAKAIKILNGPRSEQRWSQ